MMRSRIIPYTLSGHDAHMTQGLREPWGLLPKCLCAGKCSVSQCLILQIPLGKDMPWAMESVELQA